MEEVHVLPQRNWTRAKLQTSRQISHLKPAPEPASSLLPSLSSGGVVNLHGPSDARRLPDQRVMKNNKTAGGWQAAAGNTTAVPSHDCLLCNRWKSLSPDATKRGREKKEQNQLWLCCRRMTSLRWYFLSCKHGPSSLWLKWRAFLVDLKLKRQKKYILFSL